MKIDRLNQPNKDIFVFVPAQAGTWTDGDVVRGTVRVKPTSRPQRVNITFRGRMKCAITRSNGQSSTTYKEKPEFFSHTSELFTASSLGQSYDIVSKGVTEDDRVELPFEFTWPRRTELRPGPKWLPHPSFEHEAGGHLPPTFYRASSNVQLVEYFLEARLYTAGKYDASQEVRCALHYLPSPPMPNPIPPLPTIAHMYRLQGITTRTHRLHPDYDPDEGLRARIRHSWNKNKDTTPYANYKVDVSCPSVVIPGQPIVLTLSLHHLERSKDIPEPPPVHLRRISVRMSTEMKVRIPSRSLFGHSDMSDTRHDRYTILDKSFNTGEGLMFFDSMTVTTPGFPLQIVPAFRTYGLELRHKMKVEIWGECAREKFRFIPVEGPIRIVPGSNLTSDLPLASALPPSIDAKGAGPSNQTPPAAEEEAAPPPYQVLDKN